MTPALRKAAPWSAGLPALLIHVVPVFRKSALPGILLAGSRAGRVRHSHPAAGDFLRQCGAGCADPPIRQRPSGWWSCPNRSRCLVS